MFVQQFFQLFLCILDFLIQCCILFLTARLCFHTASTSSPSHGALSSSVQPPLASIPGLLNGTGRYHLCACYSQQIWRPVQPACTAASRWILSASAAAALASASSCLFLSSACCLASSSICKPGASQW